MNNLISMLFLVAALSTHTGEALAKSPTKKAPTSAKRSSIDNREGKKAVVLGEIGSVDLLHTGVGGQVGLFISPRVMLEGDYMQANFEFFDYQSKVTLMTARMKYFLGNSFYVQGGLGTRQIESRTASSTLFLDESDGDTSSEFNSTALVSEVGLGNRWQFSNFTIGCDWVGYVAPISRLSHSESFGSDKSEASQDEDRKTFAGDEDRGNLLLVRFHMGWAF